MGAAKKKDLLNKKAEQYKMMDTANKKDLLKEQNNTKHWILLRTKICQKSRTIQNNGYHLEAKPWQMQRGIQLLE